MVKLRGIPFSRPKINPPKPGPPGIRPVYIWLLFLMTIVVMGKMSLSKNRPFLEYDDRGQPKLAPWRKDDLDRGLDQYKHAEQYALIASSASMFPCYSCQGSTKIQLNVGEIWKYGVTMKGQPGRYPKGLPVGFLVYQVQFEGNLMECLEQEKIKIINYAILPENLKREKPLIRPPGNKRDF